MAASILAKNAKFCSFVYIKRYWRPLISNQNKKIEKIAFFGHTFSVSKSFSKSWDFNWLSGIGGMVVGEIGFKPLLALEIEVFEDWTMLKFEEHISFRIWDACMA